MNELRIPHPISLIVSDVDGTLVNTAKKVTAGTIAAVEAACQQGIRFAIASGRAWGEMEEIRRTLPMAQTFICSNGALVLNYRNGQTEILYRCSFTAQEARRLLRVLEPLDVYTEAYAGSDIYGEARFLPHFNDYVNATIAPLLRATRHMIPHMADYIIDNAIPIEKVQVFYGTAEKKEKAKRAVEALGSFTVIESSEGNLEFTLPHISKGRAVKALAESMGITAHQVMTIGDSNNDLSMLDYAEVSFAMANGEDTAKQTAKYLTDSNDKDGVAKAIYAVLARQGK